MKIFKCLDCKNVLKKEDDIIMVRCGCGGKMIEVDSKHRPVKNELEKICSKNKCESCPLRDVKCF